MADPSLRHLLLESLDHFEAMRAKRVLRLCALGRGGQVPLATADALLTEILVAMRAHLTLAPDTERPSPPDHMTCVHGYVLGEECAQCREIAGASTVAPFKGGW